MDTVSAAKRSEIMSRIRGDNLKPEATVAQAFKRLRRKPDRNSKDLPGKPDFALRQSRIAVFVHGCFWHSCPAHRRQPKTNAEFWAGKFEANRKRDNRARRSLNRMGWSVVVLWEHDTKLGVEHVTRVLRSRLDRASP